MAYKYREDLVGKRFLSVSGVNKLNVNNVSEWGWKAGVIRAASVKDNNNKDLQVLVEYDGLDWQRRDWVAVYSRRTFRVFLVEKTLVWGPRQHEGQDVKWPALTFTPLVSDTSLPGDSQPLEFLHDRKLDFVDYSLLQPFQEWDIQLSGAKLGAEAELLASLSSEAALWKSCQDGQRILTTTPSVLGGCRAQVYRAAGATQWYTAVIVGFNEHTGELTVTDDTVLEEHSEDPALVQMTLLGDGVVESIMRGEVVGVMPRRSRSNLQRIERESAKSPASTGSRKKTSAVKSNGQLAPTDPPTDSRTDSTNEIETIESNKKDRGGDVPEERCSVAAVSADARRGAVASEEDDCVIVCARDAEPGVRAMAHGYGGGPPPPLLHLPAQASAIYTDLLWKQRAYAPPVHSQLHHALPEDYLAAASYDRERHERLLRERRDQEQRELEKQQQQQQQKQEKERAEREKLDREERERREEKERQDSASKLVSRHFEESLRLASQKQQRGMPWSMMSPLAARGAEHERARLGYYPAAAAPARPPAPHPQARLPQEKLYPYPAYRHKEPRLPAPPPLVPEPGSVIVKHEAKRPDMYPRPAYRPALSPLADKQRPPRGYAPPAPPRSPAFYARPGPGPAYGKPSPAHYAAAASPPPPARPAPVPYPPPSAYSPQPRARPPPAAHRTPEPRPPSTCPEPCQTQPLDLGVASRVGGGDDPDRLSPRRRFPFDPSSDPESKRRRLGARSPPPARPGSEPPPPPPASPAAARSPPAAPPAAAPAPAATPPAPPAATSPAPREPVRHLGKKAWLQRHETAPAADGDRSGGGGVCVTLPMAVCPPAREPAESPPAPQPVVTPPTEPESAPTPPLKPKTTPKPKKPKENGTIEEEDSSSSERDSAALKRKPPKAKRKKGKTKVVEEAVKKKKASAESGSESDKESDDKDSDSGGSNSTGGRGARGARGRRGARGARGRRRGHDDKGARGQRQHSGDSFLQNGPCFEVAPRLAKCRECRWSPAQRDKDMPNIFCRFYAFRRLKYAKNRQLAIAGFCDPHRDADLEDKKLWISSTADAAELDIEMSCFLLREIGDQFCQLLQEEKEAESLHLNEDKTVAWKRVVQGVREMCDVCETTLFNYHWTCAKCGFVVCLDCYKSRTAGNTSSNSNTSSTDLSTNNTDSNEERDSHGWLTCTVGGAHGPRRLLLTQIAAGGALAGVAARAHRARADWGLPACACRAAPTPETARRAKAAKLLRRATAQNIKEEDIKKEENGPTNGTSPVKSENGKTGALPWLAGKMSPKKEKDSDSSSSESEEGGAGGEFSTLRELLLSEGEAVPRSRGRRSDAAVLADVLASVGAAPAQRYARGEPLRYMTCAESRALYPAPHAWLCDGRLLHLTDPATRDNLAPFQNQWKRGQPVLVSDLTSVLDKTLWSPASFSRDFGDLRVDLVNCASGCVVPNMPARKFWDGFDKFAKRLRDDNEAAMTLKLKDWPPGEDFAELMPRRFEQLMKALPLSEYTSRAGKLNLASRLPDCFVRPDLGPKMYTAYGGASGTTNLHVDVSDAVNVLVHASAPSDAPDRGKDAERAADAAALDVLTQRRARGRPPAALWHVYEARDADKIRDFLLGIQSERGVRPRDSHDPVHDQTWYLDARLRERLYADYGVEGYAILQCPGDALFVPAGAPHQVRNLLDCVKVAEDFVSPEHVSRCFELAQQFRKLSRRHANREDKLQIKNIVYHAVKDSLCCLEAALDAEDKAN